MDDQALMIRIEAEDAFSPAFEQIQDTLARTSAATTDAAQGFTGLDQAVAQAASGLEGVQEALTATSAAAEDHFRTLDAALNGSGAGSGVASMGADRAERFLEAQGLPSVMQSGMAGFRQGPGIEALGGKMGVDFQGVADNLSGLTDGLTSGISGGMMSGGIGAGVALLMQNPVMQQHMARLNELLQELITPIAEALGPSLEALAPLIQELRPVFALIGETLRLYLGPLVQELRLGFQAEQAVVAALKPVGDALVDLKSSIENIGGPFGGGGGGGGGGPHLDIGGVRIFDTGGIVGPDAGPAPAGMPGHRLVLAQLGERMVPPGSDLPLGGGAAGASAFHFHVQASDPRAAAREIRQVIEELIVTRRLGVA